MIEQLELRNFRSFQATGPIDIKPINILVGKNSAGKSSLLRLFPLLRQSVESEIKGSILWFGKFVDFGSFADARFNQSHDKSITFTFKVDRIRQTRFSTVPPDILSPTVSNREQPTTSALCHIQLGRGDADSIGLPSKIKLEIFGDVIEIFISSPLDISVQINGKKVALPSRTTWHASEGRLVPRLFLLEKIQSTPVPRFSMAGDARTSEWIAQKLHKIVHRNTSIMRLEYLASELTFQGKDSFFLSLARSPHCTTKMTQTLTKLGSTSTAVEDLRSSVLVKTLPSIIEELDLQLSSFARGVRYIEPVRAYAERFYRLQDLAVDEIDSRGANTAMFLNSLSDHDAQKLQEWTRSLFGFHAYADRTSGHVAIMVKNGNEEPKNIADLGFGFSQLLPIILQLWFSCIHSRRMSFRSSRPSLVAMEQPELHLHPHYQALLADVFAGVARAVVKKDLSTPLFIETHSEHIVNRLGALIREGRVEPHQVQVLLFEKDGPSTQIRAVGFDIEGVLDSNWPLGFFVPEL